MRRWTHRSAWRLIPLFALLLVSATRFSDAAESAPDQQGKAEAFEKQFLVFGTVFTEQGFALPGAEIRIRRAGQRKARWEGRSDRRGEFAVRVPKGEDYEITVTARGYREEARKVDARSGSREDLVFRLQPAAGGKPK